MPDQFKDGLRALKDEFRKREEAARPNPWRMPMWLAVSSIVAGAIAIIPRWLARSSDRVWKWIIILTLIVIIGILVLFAMVTRALFT
jgi:hypothetical protein